MRRAARGLVVLAALALGGAPAGARAADRHVDPASGSDSADGATPDRAWRTLARASEEDLAPGDRVLLRGGARHPGTLVLSAEDAGTPERPVVVGAYGDGRATIDAGTATGVKVFDAGGVEVRDLRVVGAGRAAGNRGNGVELFTALGGGRKLDHVRVERVEATGFGGAGVLVGSWPEDGTKSGFRGVRIADVVVHGNADAGVHVYGRPSATVAGFAHADLVVDRVTAHDNPGISLKSSNSGSGIMLGDVDGALVQRSVAHHNGARNDYPFGGPVGVWAYDARAVTVQDNESYANASRTVDGGGFDFDGGVTDSVMQRNLSHGNAGAGFLGYRYWGGGPWERNVFRFNVSDGDARTNLAGMYLGGGVEDLEVHHNTVITRPREDGTTPVAVLTENVTSSRLRANAFATTGSGLVIDDTVGRPAIRFEGNAYPAGSLFRSRGATSAGLAAWRRASGQEVVDGRPAGVEGDPRLPAMADPASALLAGPVAAGRYRPAAGSVLLGAAPDLRALFGLDPGPADAAGTPHGPGAPRDLGALQPAPPAPPPPPPPLPPEPPRHDPGPTVPVPPPSGGPPPGPAQPPTPPGAPPPVAPRPPSRSAPRLALVALRPAPGAAAACRPVRISARVRPARTAALRVRVTLDGRTRPARLDRTTGTVRVPAVRLRPGRHRVRVSVAAGRGASVTRAWAFTVRRC